MSGAMKVVCGLLALVGAIGVLSWVVVTVTGEVSNGGGGFTSPDEAEARGASREVGHSPALQGPEGTGRVHVAESVEGGEGARGLVDSSDGAGGAGVAGESFGFLVKCIDGGRRIGWQDVLKARPELRDLELRVWREGRVVHEQPCEILTRNAGRIILARPLDLDAVARIDVVALGGHLVRTLVREGPDTYLLDVSDLMVGYRVVVRFTGHVAERGVMPLGLLAVSGEGESVEVNNLQRQEESIAISLEPGEYEVFASCGPYQAVEQVSVGAEDRVVRLNFAALRTVSVGTADDAVGKVYVAQDFGVLQAAVGGASLAGSRVLDRGSEDGRWRAEVSDGFYCAIGLSVLEVPSERGGGVLGLAFVNFEVDGGDVRVDIPRLTGRVGTVAFGEGAGGQFVLYDDAGGVKLFEGEMPPGSALRLPSGRYRVGGLSDGADRVEGALIDVAPGSTLHWPI